MNLLVRFLGPILLRRFLRRRQARRSMTGTRDTGRSRVGGGFFGPLPYATTRTRGGRVGVTGCCLPLASAPLWTGGLLLALRRRRLR